MSVKPVFKTFGQLKTGTVNLRQRYSKEKHFIYFVRVESYKVPRFILEGNYPCVWDASILVNAFIYKVIQMKKPFLA